MIRGKFLKWVKDAFVSVSVIAILSACADDHFDINPEVEGRKTLWENIASNEELSEFADLLQRINYTKPGNYTTTVETYADLFNGNQTFTVWAPKNGTFDYAAYDALLNTGNPDDAYKVEQELIRNSMTRFSHLMVGSDSVRILMFNGKNAYFHKHKSMIKDQNVITANIGSKNGVLHIVDGPIEYQPNIYEFMATRDDLDSINAFINGYEKLEFNETLSTQGPTVNGLVTWVDSIFTKTNSYFSYLGTSLTQEDSLYAMILPTNDAWKGALEKMRSYYVYKSKYAQDIATVTQTGKDTTIKGVETTFTQAELDSIINFRSKNAICRNLVFNMNAQKGCDYTKYGVEGACDSLVSTSGTVFYNPYSARLFNGAAPIEVSNGYAYIVDQFNYRPSDSWASDMEVEAELAKNLETGDKNTNLSRVSYSKNVKYEWNGVEKDTVIRYSSLVMKHKSSSVHPGATFILRDLLSCKYDIYVLVSFNEEEGKPNKFKATLAYDESETKRNNNKALKNPNVEDTENYNTQYFASKAPYVDENGEYRLVDSVLVAEDFMFPICYEGLSNAYVTLKLQGYFKSSEKSKYSRELRIDKIVLKAKE